MPDSQSPLPFSLVLLENLCAEWLATRTPNEIGSDVEKIVLLKQATREVPGFPAKISERLRSLYEEVFLRPVDEVSTIPIVS